MAERGGLENRYTRKGIEGSNPSLSANCLAAGRQPAECPKLHCPGVKGWVYLDSISV